MKSRLSRNVRTAHARRLAAASAAFAAGHSSQDAPLFAAIFAGAGALSGWRVRLEPAAPGGGAPAVMNALMDAIAAAGNVQSDEVTHRDFRFEAPYSAGKLLIAVQIASVFRLKCVRTESGANNVMCAFGTKSKLDDFEMLLTAVNMHATGEHHVGFPGAQRLDAFVDGDQ